MSGGRYVVYSPAGGEVHGEFRYFTAFDKAEAKRKADALRRMVKARGWLRVGIAHRPARPTI